MARFKENDLPKSKITATSLNKAKTIFTYAGNHKWKFFIGLIFLLLTGATALAFPKLMGMLVDCVKNKDNGEANTIALGLIAILFLQSFFSFFRLSLFVNFTENTLANLRLALYTNLVKLPMTFFSQKRVGELNSRISADITQIQDTLTTTIAEFLRQFILIIGGVILLATESLKLTLLMLSVVPLVAIAAVVFGRFIRKYSKKVQDQVAESQVIVEETMQGISIVKAFANEWYEIARYKGKISDVVKLAIKGGQYRGYFASFIIFCLFGAIVAVVWFGVRLSIAGEMSVGQLISFVLYSTFVGASFGGIAELYAQIQKAIGATERVFELLDENPEKINSNSNQNKEKIKGNVTFNNVAFSYPTRQEIQVLKDVNFKAEFGQKIAIVGPSGAGKSTISSLLLRFYDITSGEITVDGKNIYDYDLEDLRGNMSIVPQDVILFGGTIRENIAYGKPDATDEEIIQAAKQANAFNFVDGFPEKFETLVGERGVKLSGGQRQRIAIARALLKNPSILILDEATSSLDSESEKLVQEALEVLMEGRTSIIIAHRLSTIRNADKILVLDNGKISEEGTHQELINLENGIYKNLSNLQFSNS
ncbi:ABC transporter ATP-binding protein [Flavobacterium johnsoniae]|jgi:ABC transporter fused permease/ATP-binding protein|uniref:ABC transporter, permease/ATP-binding protein n=2 Tax=Flavobacterium johnsoniae TaxID=986 RepID=A0A1M6TKT4_FLAJO|nr:ABC transporter transmembrane domain-containing protein [Flavobacterium johnsoniae]ABQ05837.1 ABC transporter related [Flavobacterium johnsoniae UW101]OXG01076.1 multidrug ABC transporter ATP-binding protein [Flavobacterium johnsoniae UW101]WQG81573.1 ABC transporter transmembrane domain-containing protein [Flavobacterium johnsoniae UW101]SHH67895.1 ABC transporter, permease/ATP-binding protein [Flavobacterium johnsoniae]SHK57499.1 ABC transporter, permease/ATP-binding protein [Flavobacteri